MRWIFGGLLVALLWTQPLYAKLIRLHYLSANTVLPVLQPLLQSGEQISGQDDFIVLNASPSTLTAVRSVLQQLDVKPVTFHISVYQGPPQGLMTKDQYYSTDMTSKKGMSSIQVLNGQTAQITMVKEVPVISALGYGFFTGITYQAHPVRNGLFLSPQAKGSLVQVTLYQVNQQQEIQAPQTFVGKELKTSVLLPFDQWIAINPAGHEQNTYSSNSQWNNTLYIKVSKAY